MKLTKEKEGMDGCKTESCSHKIILTPDAEAVNFFLTNPKLAKR